VLLYPYDCDQWLWFFYIVVYVCSAMKMCNLLTWIHQRFLYTFAIYLAIYFNCC